MGIFKLNIILILLSLFISQLSFSESSKKLSLVGVQCKLNYQGEQFEKAFKYCLKSAEGDLEVENPLTDEHPDVYKYLANMYYEGKGTDKDLKKAFDWFEKAALLGDEFSIIKVAHFSYQKALKETDEEEKNNWYKKSFKWFKKSADEGDMISQYNTGIMYKKGLGVEQDYKKSGFFFAKAAKQGHVNSLNSLGYFYLKGLGLKANFNKAKLLFEKAISKDANQVESYYHLAYIYYHGLGLPVDYEKAFNLYFKVAQEAGNEYPESQYVLASMYYKGEGVEQNFDSVIFWIQKAMESCYEPAFDFFEQLEGDTSPFKKACN